MIFGREESKNTARKKSLQRPERDSAPLFEIILNEATKYRISNYIFPAMRPDYKIIGSDDLDKNVEENVNEMLDELTRLSVVSSRVLSMLSDNNAKSGEISKMITSDPILSTKILTVANSAFFNFNQKVTAIDRAIALLGFSNIRSIVMQDLIRNFLPTGGTIRHEKLWLHSSAAYTVSYHLSFNTLKLADDEICTVGMMHDMGKYYIRSLPRIGEAPEGMPVLFQEQYEYGINHATLGYMVAKRLSLPDSICNAILYHHHPHVAQPEEIPSELLKKVSVVALTDTIINILGFDDGFQKAYRLKEDYFKILGLKNDLLEIITQELVDELNASTQFVKTLMNN